MPIEAVGLTFEIFTRHQVLYEEIARSHPSLLNATVYCARCGRPRAIEAARCLRDGWPKCEETVRCATRTEQRS